MTAFSVSDAGEEVDHTYLTIASIYLTITKISNRSTLLKNVSLNGTGPLDNCQAHGESPCYF